MPTSGPSSERERAKADQLAKVLTARARSESKHATPGGVAAKGTEAASDDDIASSPTIEEAVLQAVVRSGADEDESVPPSSADGLDEEHRAFFERAEEAVAREHAAEQRRLHAEAEPVVYRPSTEVLARRHRLRRVVTGVVSFAAVLSIVGVVRSIAHGRPSIAHESMNASLAATPAADPRAVADAPAAPPAAAPQATQPPAPAAQAPEPQAAKLQASEPQAAKPQVGEPQGAAPPAAAAQPTPAQGADTAALVASATHTTGAAQAAASASPSTNTAAADPAQAADLTRKALKSLDKGDLKGAIEHADAAVQADPSDANAYLYWGTALINQGKMADAKRVFSRCVEQATHGPKQECRQFR